MLSCARYGEPDDLKEMLKDESIPIDYQNESYNTALHYASANGNIECIDLLLQRGARHLPNSSGNTPLHWAVQNKHADAVRLLLARAPAVDVLQKNGFGKSALTDAFALDTADITQLLLEHPSAAALDAAAGVVEEESDEPSADADAGGQGMDVDAAAAAAGAAGDSMETA
jgi:ankyrin repeat protein